VKNDQSKEKAGANGGLEPAECIERLKFETLMTDLSARFIHLPAEQVDAAIVDSLRRICECTGLDVVVLWQREADAPGIFTLTHHYRRREGPPLTRELQAAEFFPWGLREVQAGRSFLFASLDEVPEGAERDRDSLRYFGALNTLVLPLSVGGGAPFGRSLSTTWSAPRVWKTRWSTGWKWWRGSSPTPWRTGDTKRRCGKARPVGLGGGIGRVGLWSLDLATGAIGRTDKAKETFGFGPEEESRWSASWRRPAEDRILIGKSSTRWWRPEKKAASVSHRPPRRADALGGFARPGARGPAGRPPTHLMGVTTDITDPKMPRDCSNRANSVGRRDGRRRAGVLRSGERRARDLLDRRARELIGRRRPTRKPAGYSSSGNARPPEDLSRVRN
jgi:hypothetical protein